MYGRQKSSISCHIANQTRLLCHCFTNKDFFSFPFHYIYPWYLYLAPAYQKITFIYNIPFLLNSLNPGFWCAPYSKMKFTPFTLLLVTPAIILITLPRSLKVHTVVFTFIWFHKILREFSYKSSSQFNSQFNWSEKKKTKPQENKTARLYGNTCMRLLKRKCRPKKNVTGCFGFFFLGETWIKIGMRT